MLYTSKCQLLRLSHVLDDGFDNMREGANEWFSNAGNRIRDWWSNAGKTNHVSQLIRLMSLTVIEITLKLIQVKQQKILDMVSKKVSNIQVTTLLVVLVTFMMEQEISLVEQVVLLVEDQKLLVKIFKTENKNDNQKHSIS